MWVKLPTSWRESGGQLPAAADIRGLDATGRSQSVADVGRRAARIKFLALSIQGALFPVASGPSCFTRSPLIVI